MHNMPSSLVTKLCNDDIGIEQASPESIRKALSTLHVESLESSNEFFHGGFSAVWTFRYAR